MSLLSLIKGRRGASGFGYASTAEEVTAGVDLHGKTVLVTGVTSGLGLETARVMALRGARVIGLARAKEKAAEALAPFGADHAAVACELSEPASVRGAVDDVRALGVSIDAMILNAGIMALPERTLKHGQELQFLTNHIGHFILAMGLLDGLSERGRVVVLSSSAHQQAPRVGIVFDDITLSRSYTPWGAYGQSKLANLLFARWLAKRFEGTGRTANAVHPGVIATNLGRHMSPAMRVLMPVANAIAFKTVPEGAATQCWAAVNPATASLRGEYLADCNVATSTANGRDLAMAERLVRVTEEIVAKL
jgi:NAD(P)-dependent dehydrogenase (short-subunit alcohol dehydrogenase family)